MRESSGRDCRQPCDQRYDIYLIGVGGQGLLTIGDLIAEAALKEGLFVNVYPAKGMAQRGGSVSVQVRLGCDTVGPRIPEHAADLIVAMERSEALKAVRYVRPDGDFVLYGQVWEPAQVMLGRSDYPDLALVKEKILEAGADLHYLDPARLPRRNGTPVPANVYVLGAALSYSGLNRRIDTETVVEVVAKRWEKQAALNKAALRAGLEATADGE